MVNTRRIATSYRWKQLNIPMPLTSINAIRAVRNHLPSLETIGFSSIVEFGDHGELLLNLFEHIPWLRRLELGCMDFISHITVPCT